MRSSNGGPEFGDDGLSSDEGEGEGDGDGDEGLDDGWEWAFEPTPLTPLTL